jgi:hypothetical protein
LELSTALATRGSDKGIKMEQYMGTAIYLTKLLFACAGMWFLYMSTSKDAKSWSLPIGCLLFGCVLFMTGVELISTDEHVWTYLFFEANQEDYGKALWGGMLMLSIPFVLYAFCGKNIAQMLEANRNELLENSNKRSTEE